MNPIKHLLVIRLSAMGDVAMSVPVLKAFLDQYPDIQVTVLTKGFFAPLFSQLPNVNVHVADVKGRHKGIFGLRRIYKELKSTFLPESHFWARIESFLFDCLVLRGFLLLFRALITSTMVKQQAAKRLGKDFLPHCKVKARLDSVILSPLRDKKLLNFKRK